MGLDSALPDPPSTSRIGDDIALIASFIILSELGARVVGHGVTGMISAAFVSAQTLSGRLDCFPIGNSSRAVIGETR